MHMFLISRSIQLDGCVLQLGDTSYVQESYMVGSSLMRTMV